METTAHGIAHPDVSLGTTLAFAALLVVLIVALALEERLHARKSFIAGVMAVVCLLAATYAGLLPFGPVVDAFGQRIAIPVYVTAVDWGVITVILGSSLFVDVASGSGLFTWIAIRMTKLSRGDPRRLVWLYGVMTVVFSAVLNNVTAMIIVGSLTVVSLQRLDRTAYLPGLLLVEGLLTNIGGLLTLISSVPNIIVGGVAHISFARFFVVASPFVVVATVGTVLAGIRLFGIAPLATDAERARARALVDSFDETDGIRSWRFFGFSAVATVLFIVTIATTSALPGIDALGIGFVALAFALVVLVPYRHEVDRYYRAIDWDLLGFFVSLFVVVNVMEHARVLALIGRGLSAIVGLGPHAGAGLVLVGSAAFSSVTDNIPLAAMLARILHEMGTPEESRLWWSVIFGANLGGNLTPIGSASTLVAVTLMQRHGIRMGFGAFVVRALPFALIQIALATLYVLVAL